MNRKSQKEWQLSNKHSKYEENFYVIYLNMIKTSKRNYQILFFSLKLLTLTRLYQCFSSNATPLKKIISVVVQNTTLPRFASHLAKKLIDYFWTILALYTLQQSCKRKVLWEKLRNLFFRFSHFQVANYIVVNIILLAYTPLKESQKTVSIIFSTEDYVFTFLGGGRRALINPLCEFLFR